MSTLANLQPQIHEIPKRLPQTVVPLKMGLYGPTGAGKTTTSALLALALSKLYHGGAPVLITDTEIRWQFLRPIFAQEGVELIQRTEPTFRAMCANLREAEKLGCSVFVVDSLTRIWQELMKAARGDASYIDIDKWGPIKDTWNEYVTLFANSRVHCIAAGRFQNDYDEVENPKNPAKTRLVKLGTKFKAGGSESFGYETNLLLELSLERRSKTKKGTVLEAEGRIIHRADVLKDCTWTMNGSIFRWPDKNKYVPGGYSAVWESLKPHFAAVQQTAQVTLQSGSSAAMFDTEGDSEHYRMIRRKQVLSAELHASMEYLWGGMSAEAKKMRMDVFEHIFGFRTKESADQASLSVLERGVRVLQEFEKPIKAGTIDFPVDKAETLKGIDFIVQNFDKITAEEEAMPF